MKAHRLAAFALVVSVTMACDAGQAARVDKEIARLEAALKSVEAASADLPKDVHPLFEIHRAALDRARKASAPEYRLYRLRDPFVGIETLAFLLVERSSGTTVANFEKLWRGSGGRFEAKPPDARGSLLERALIESSATRAGRLYRASLPYAKASAPWSGVYYLGEAEGNLRFRDFVLSIASEDVEKTPARERLAAMLEDLERDTLSFFGNDVTNQQVVPVSVRLKETHELLDAGQVEGATLMLVEARAALSRRGGPRGKNVASAKPHAESLAAVLEAWAGDEQAPMSDALRKEVVPFYGALFAAAPRQTRTRAAQITVTLIRWPYT
jgi:hypothetical protein